MRLYSNAMSPYGRKVAVVIHALGLGERIQQIPAQPRERPDEVIAVNPLGKIPVLVTEDGLCLRDSPVIAEYLCDCFGGESLLPRSGTERWRIMVEMADADAIIESAVLVKNERTRPDIQQSASFITEHLGKIERGLAAVEAMAAELAGRRDLGAIAIGCALGYVPRRVPEHAGLARFPAAARVYGALQGWPPFAATEPPGQI